MSRTIVATPRTPRRSAPGRPAWLPGWAVSALAAAVIALAIFAFFGHAFLNYDTFYALEWGKQLVHGMSPDYQVPVAPTPHPLAELVGMPLSVFGDSAEAVALGIVLLSFGFLCMALYRLGSELFAWPVGLLAVLIAATRVPLLNFGIRGYVDLPAIALILWAGVLEARRPRRGAPVLALLALAGLLRPEAWLFSAVYWLWIAPPLRWPERIRLALLAAAGPIVWLASDALVTGDALWSFHGTHDLAAQLQRKRGLGNVPGVLPRRLGEIVRLPELVTSVVGFAFGLWLLRRRARLPAAIAVLNGVTFLVLAVAGLPLIGRYLFLAGAVLSLFAAVGALGWLALPAGHEWRTRWKVIGLACLAGIVVFFPLQQVHRLTTLRDDIANRARIQADLLTLVRKPAAATALRRCGTLYVPNHRPVPSLAYWTGRRPRDIVSAGLQRPAANGLYVGPTTARVANLSILDPKDPSKRQPYAPGTGPSGYHQLARNSSWVLWAGCGPA